MTAPDPSPPDLLVLHAVRLQGMADDSQVTTRFDLDPAVAGELLLDFQATGWVTHVDFAGTTGWCLTESGRAQNERQLAAELTATGAGPVVREVYLDFLPANDRLLRACTSWQLRPSATDPLAANDHTDRSWDQQVLDDLSELAETLRALCGRVSSRLERFGGYDDRFATALARAERGELSWVTRPRVDSCHTVWMELHEDLVATLGIERGAEPSP